MTYFIAVILWLYADNSIIWKLEHVLFVNGQGLMLDICVLASSPISVKHSKAEKKLWKWGVQRCCTLQIDLTRIVYCCECLTTCHLCVCLLVLLASLTCLLILNFRYRNAYDTSTTICQCGVHGNVQNDFLREIFQLVGRRLTSVAREDGLLVNFLNSTIYCLDNIRCLGIGIPMPMLSHK